MEDRAPDALQLCSKCDFPPLIRSKVTECGGESENFLTRLSGFRDRRGLFAFNICILKASTCSENRRDGSSLSVSVLFFFFFFAEHGCCRKCQFF